MRKRLRKKKMLGEFVPVTTKIEAPALDASDAVLEKLEAVGILPVFWGPGFVKFTGCGYGSPMGKKWRICCKRVSTGPGEPLSPHEIEQIEQALATKIVWRQYRERYPFHHPRSGPARRKVT